MKVGTICKLKVDCLSNKAGTLGVVFYDYGDGFQVIFKNGHYDGFSVNRVEGKDRGCIKTDPSEADRFLKEVGFEKSLAGYQFKSVVQVSMDYRHGLFDRAWSIFWQKAAEQIEQAEEIKRTPNRSGRPNLSYGQEPEPKPTEYEKCEVYADGNRPALLRFKRKIHTGEKQTPTIQSRHLSVAMDYVDFSHFEYAGLFESLEPRRLQLGKTICPLYVVFRKKL